LSLPDILDDIGWWLAVFFEALADFASEHPLLTILLFIVLFFGGCGIVLKVHIVSSSTKLMPY
jgi:hypothetical protein